MVAPSATQLAKLPPQINLFDDLQQLHDPYAMYARLREAGPILRASPGVWLLPRYEEVSAALSDSRLGSFRFDQNVRLVRPGVEQDVDSFTAARSFLDEAVVATDGPAHIHLRGALKSALAKRLTASLKQRIGNLVEQLLLPALESRALEAVSEVGHVLPVTVMAELMGIPNHAPVALTETILKLSALFSPFASEAERSAADAAVRQLRELIRASFEDRLSRPLDDIISDLAIASQHNRLTAQQAIDNSIFLLLAGIETSANMIAAGIAALAARPDQMERLKDNPGLVSTAVEEFLRFDSPTQITARRILYPLTIGGRSLSPGRVLMLLLGSANRDERQFDSPSQIDVGRSPNRHLAFGAGPHYCIGATFARIEGDALFRTLALRLSAIELRSKPVTRVSATARLYHQVDVLIAPT